MVEQLLKSNQRSYPCEECPLADCEAFRDMSEREVEFMSALKKGELQVRAGSTVLLQGTNSPHLYTVLSGWGFRYKTMPDGRRQILNFIVPGDFVGLQGTLLGEMQHSVEALSDMLLCVFERDSLMSLFEQYAELAYDITWLAAREEQILDEHLLSIGRRTAVERAAYLIAFLHDRANCVGLLNEGDPLEPFTQSHVADTLGLSLVHTNKTLRKLQDQNLIRWLDKACHVENEERLKSLASWEGLPEMKRPFI